MVVACWHGLGSCRAIGFSGAGSIPFTAILAWADFERLDRELTALLISTIQYLDADRAERLARKNS